jgi:hypothetical protein
MNSMNHLSQLILPNPLEDHLVSLVVVVVENCLEVHGNCFDFEAVGEARAVCQMVFVEVLAF